jgi:hypothetical protein
MSSRNRPENASFALQGMRASATLGHMACKKQDLTPFPRYFDNVSVSDKNLLNKVTAEFVVYMSQ